MGNNGLYHFTTIDSLIKIILTDSFLLNNIENMNDLTESKGIYENNCITYNEDTISKIQYKFKGKRNILEMLKYKGELRDNVNYLKQNTFICSFNKLSENESIYEKFSLWGYYADKNRGVAIKFNEAKLNGLFDKLINDNDFIGIRDRIEYKSFDDIELNNNEAIKLLIANNLKEVLKVKYFTKSIEWKHENEYRFIISLIENLSIKYDLRESHIYLFNIIDCIEEVIVGAESSKINIGILNCLKEKLCRKIKFTPVEKYKKNLIYEDMQMVENKENSLQNYQHTRMEITLTDYRECDFYANISSIKGMELYKLEKNK